MGFHSLVSDGRGGKKIFNHKTEGVSSQAPPTVQTSAVTTGEKIVFPTQVHLYELAITSIP